MTEAESRSAGEAFAKLAASVRELQYEYASLTLLMYADHWQLSIDAGETVDDVYEWRGRDLRPLLVAARVALSQDAPQGQVAPSVTLGVQEDFQAFLRLLNRHHHRFTHLPLDLAYVPRSRLSPAEPWELGVHLASGDAIYSGATPLAALSAALGTDGVDDSN